MFVALHTEHHLANTSDAGKVDHNGLLTNKGQYRLSIYGQATSKLQCFSAVYQAQYTLCTRHLPVRFFTSRDKRILTSCEVIKLRHEASASFSIVHGNTSLVEEMISLWTNSKCLWRVMACHWWEQRQWTLCKKWYGAAFSIEWPPRNRDGTYMFKCTLRELQLLNVVKEHNAWLSSSLWFGMTAVNAMVSMECGKEIALISSESHLCSSATKVLCSVFGYSISLLFWTLIWGKKVRPPKSRRRDLRPICCDKTTLDGMVGSFRPKTCFFTRCAHSNMTLVTGFSSMKRKQNRWAPV